MTSYERRLASCQDELEWLYMKLYDDRDRLYELEQSMTEAYAARSFTLKRLDSRREKDPDYNFIGEIDFSPEFSRYSKRTTA